MAIGFGVACPKGKSRFVLKLEKKRRQEAEERECRVMVRRRDLGKCRVCDKPSVHLHHLTKRSQGGKWRADNIVALCHRCHQAVHGAVLYLSGNPSASLYWEWLCAPLPDLSKPWGYSHPPKDPRGAGDRFRGRLAA